MTTQTKKKGDYPIPFDSDGNLLSWAQPPYPGQRVYQPGDYGYVDWQANHEFDDLLTYSGYGRGRSSATLEFKRHDGRTVSVFLSDAHDIIPKLVDGKIEGRFTFVKKGQNYGCKLA